MTATLSRTASVRVEPSAAHLTAYRDLTYPSCAPLLDHAGGDAVVAVVAAAEGRPVGLALTEVHPDGARAVVRSIYTIPERRRHGVAQALLAVTEAELRRRGVASVAGTYPAGNAAAPAVEALLARAGWDAPRPAAYLFRVGRDCLAGLARAPWLRPSDLGPGWAITAWAETTPAARAAVADRAARFQVPNALCPGTHPEPLDEAFSLVLTRDGEPFGWLLCHHLTPGHVRVTGLYVRPDCPVKGLGFRLVVEAIRRQVAACATGPLAEATWGCVAHVPMAAFTLRRIVPHLPGVVLTETRESAKRLRPA